MKVIAIASVIAYIFIVFYQESYAAFLSDTFADWKYHYTVGEKADLEKECIFRKLIVNVTETNNQYVPPLFYPEMEMPDNDPLFEIPLSGALLAGKVLHTLYKVIKEFGIKIERINRSGKNKELSKEELRRQKEKKKKNQDATKQLISQVMLWCGIFFKVYLHMCTQAYVIAPHEYLNLRAGEELYGAHQFPDGFYHCEPGWEPSQPQDRNNQNGTGKSYGESDPYAEYRWGYKDVNGTYCAHEKRTLANSVMKDKVASIGVVYGNQNPDINDITWLKAGERKFISPGVYAFAFYKNLSGSIRLCAGSMGGGLPYIIGCTAIPKPGEIPAWDQGWVSGISNTRCMYLINNRSDLISLGNSLGSLPEDSNNYAMKKFLVSDWHIFSTILGCTKDFMIQIFQHPNEKSSFEKIQDNFKPLVMVVISLYIALFAINVLMSGGTSIAEVLLGIFKISLIYTVVSTPLIAKFFPSLLHLPEAIADIFMNASNRLFDPASYCHFTLNERNILSHRIVTQGDIATHGVANGVLLSFWDLMDCKIGSYLNFGTCGYSPGSMMAIWMISSAFWATGVGVLLAMALFMYCFVLCKIVFRIVYIFLLSFFIITILCILSPLFLLFSLFDITHAMYERWAQSLLVYVLYPGTMFVIVAVIFSLLNFIYYGDLGESGSISERCSNVNSPYCLTMQRVIADKGPDYHPCASTNEGDIFTLFQSTESAGSFAVQALHQDLLDDYFHAVIKMLMICAIFYMVLETLLRYIEVVLGISSNLSAFSSVLGFDLFKAALKKAQSMSKSSNQTQDGGSS